MPAFLVDPAKRLSIHMADSIDHQDLPQAIERVTREQVLAIGDYIMQITDVAYPDIMRVTASEGPLRLGDYSARGFLSAFTPAQKRLKTGHMRNFTAEVITPEEIPEDVHKDLMRKATANNRQLTGYAAYLMTTADLYSGKRIGRLGNISCITAAGHGKATDIAPFSRISRPAIAVSRPLSTNDVLTVMASQESRAIAHVVTSQAMRRPYSGGLMH